MALYFLSQQSQDWKDKHINVMISLSGAWAGSAKAIKVYAIGIIEFVFFLHPTRIVIYYTAIL